MVQVSRERKVTAAQLAALTCRALGRMEEGLLVTASFPQASRLWLYVHLCQPNDALSRKPCEMPSDNQGGVENSIGPGVSGLKP